MPALAVDSRMPAVAQAMQKAMTACLQSSATPLGLGPVPEVRPEPRAEKGYSRPSERSGAGSRPGHRQCEDSPGTSSATVYVASRERACLSRRRQDVARTMYRAAGGEQSSAWRPSRTVPGSSRIEMPPPENKTSMRALTPASDRLKSRCTGLVERRGRGHHAAPQDRRRRVWRRATS